MLIKYSEINKEIKTNFGHFLPKEHAFLFIRGQLNNRE